MANPWFRLYSEFSHDPKVQMLSEAMQRRYVMIMCMRCSNGLVTDDLVGFHLRINMDEVIKTKAQLISSGFITEQWELLTPLESEHGRPLSHVWKAIRERIFARDDYTCQYCGERGKKLECDHVHPVSKGGTHTDNNLVTACFSCNRSKRDKLINEWSPA